MDQTTQPLPLGQPQHYYGHGQRDGFTSSETDLTTDGESDMPMSGSDVDSDVDRPTEVPGLLTSPAKEKKQRKEKKASEGKLRWWWWWWLFPRMQGFLENV